MKKKLFISDSPESKRIFKNNILEYFSKCPWYMPIIYWTPITSFLLYWGASHSTMSISKVLSLFLSGYLFWSLAEYIIHRFIFHWEPKKKDGIGERIHFLIHGVHHNYPNDSMRLVAPPSLSTIIAAPMFLLYYAILPNLEIAMAIFSGTVVGYVFYDSIHYAIHHAKFEAPWFKRLQSHHLAHHYNDDGSKYGVSPLGIIWDYIFGTR